MAAGSELFRRNHPGFQGPPLLVEGRSILAMLFDSERAPFVVTNGKGGVPERSVPWREGTRIRSASRGELVRLLSPLTIMTSFEILEAFIAFKEKQTAAAV